MEAGCPSREGSPELPNDRSMQGRPSEDAQREYDEAMLGAAEKRPWVGGFGKQAESTVREHYARLLG